MRMILMFCIRSKNHKKRDETVTLFMVFIV